MHTDHTHVTGEPYSHILKSPHHHYDYAHSNHTNGTYHPKFGSVRDFYENHLATPTPTPTPVLREKRTDFNEKILQVYIGGIGVVGLLLLYRLLEK